MAVVVKTRFESLGCSVHHPFWNLFWWDWDVHWGYDLAFDTWAFVSFWRKDTNNRRGFSFLVFDFLKDANRDGQFVMFSGHSI